ncbi:MAG: hypothetical protein J6A15_07235 [Clostridia bacterium]|nr:hypothetical protein [Clostridia bacterium]
MITKLSKQNMLNNIKDKEERMKYSNIIDKCNRCEASSKITATSFLDLNEIRNITSMLNRENVKYDIFYANEYCEKATIFFLPEYMENTDINCEDYISCIKITAKDMVKLRHKDFMGSIYSLGIKNEFLGDIFLTEKACYIFVNKTVDSYILDNLFKVANQEVVCELISLNSKEAKELKIEYITKSYIIPSRRVDALLAEVYSLSRKESKDKIVAGDLYINAKECINPSEEFNDGDIISFRKCGKLKVGSELRTTKSGNICIDINRYK